MWAGPTFVDRRRDLLCAAILGWLQHYPKAWTAERAGVMATFEIVSAIGWAPHDSQQKPLRPGSAQKVGGCTQARSGR